MHAWLLNSLLLWCSSFGSALLARGKQSPPNLKSLRTDEKHFVSYEVLSRLRPTMKEMYQAYLSPGIDDFDHWIPQDIEVQLPADDLDLYGLFSDFKLLGSKAKEIKVDSRLWSMLKEIDSADSAESAMSEASIKSRYQPGSRNGVTKALTEAWNSLVGNFQGNSDDNSQASDTIDASSAQSRLTALSNLTTSLLSQISGGIGSSLSKSENNNHNDTIVNDNNRRRMFGNAMRRRGRLPGVYNINGLTSDYARRSTGTPSTGGNGQYWLVKDKCAQRKQCQVYNHVRYLPKSEDDGDFDYGCQSIHTELLPQIIDCIRTKGLRKCEMVLDHGYFRIVFLVNDSRRNSKVVLKMMKPSSINNGRDLLRHIRESVLLSLLNRMEKLIIKYQRNSDDLTEKDQLLLNDIDDQIKELNEFDIIRHGTKMTMDDENDDNNGVLKKDDSDFDLHVFHIVPELGHCLYPTFMSISPFFDVNLEHYIEQGQTKNATLKQAMDWAVQISESLEVIHNFPGGPFHHTDIQPRQFMVDLYTNPQSPRLLLNDFNRGKFQMKYFSGMKGTKKKRKSNNLESKDYALDCPYCGHRSHGRWRAPEELNAETLDEKLDVFSTAQVILALFSFHEPLPNVRSKSLSNVYNKEWRKPRMPANMPWALKQVIQRALMNDPRARPTARQMRQEIEFIRDEIDSLSSGNTNVTLRELQKRRSFPDSNFQHSEDVSLVKKPKH